MTQTQFLVRTPCVIYLDHHTASFPRPGVLEAMTTVVAQGGNPSSLHTLGRRARQHLERAQAKIRAFCDSQRAEVVGCGSLDEARALAILGMARAHRAADAARVVVGLDAELCARAPGLLAQLQREAFKLALWANTEQDAEPQLHRVRVHAPFGPDATQQVTSDEVAVVAGCTLDWALQRKPLRRLSTWVKDFGFPWYLEAGADFSERSWAFDDLNVTASAFAGAPLGGPPATAALVLKKQAALWPLWGGGQQQLGRRPGTEAVALLVGLAHALEVLQTKYAFEQQHFGVWRQRVLEALGADKVVASDITSSIVIPIDVHRVSQAVLALGHQGLMVGWATAPAWTVTTNPTAPQGAALHLCMGWNTCETDIVAAMTILKATQEIWEKQV